MTRPEGPDYPVVLSLNHRPCLVVGAGPVAARKARGLLDAGAEMTVVAPQVSRAMQDVVDASGRPSETALGRLRLELRAYRPGEAAGYAFVVAATGDPAVDRRVTDDALAAGALVNGAPDDRTGAVRLPAVLRRGAVTVAVSTGGRSPALARWTRDHIASSSGPDLALLCELMEEARARAGQNASGNDGIDWAAAIAEVVPLLEAGEVDEARRRLAWATGRR